MCRSATVQRSESTAEVKRRVKALMKAVKEVEAQKDTLDRDALLCTGLYDALGQLADANRNTAKLQPSQRAADLLAHWEARFRGIASRAEARAQG
ncbi:hypothetical protein BD414DRAFT_533040 [Trametes punicea]|nr:hypothetical protein BD414DRAFT_533040 [Trametes punicea]